MTPAAPAARERILDAAHALVLEQGFSATTVDAVLAAAEASKGAFFHHFPSKAALGLALVERYAEADAEVLESFLAVVRKRTDDPVRQVVELVRDFEEGADDLALDQPGCLFVTFVTEHVPETAATRAVVLASVELWRSRLLELLEAAATASPPDPPVDLPSLADQLFTTFEGAFILARATGDAGHVRRQLAHLRHYLELLFDRPGGRPTADGPGSGTPG